MAEEPPRGSYAIKYVCMYVCMILVLVRMRRSNKIGKPGDGTSGRVAKALYLDDAPRDFGPELASSLSTLSFHAGRETKVGF